MGFPYSEDIELARAVVVVCVVVVGRGITVASLINTPPSLFPSLHVLFLLSMYSPLFLLSLPLLPFINARARTVCAEICAYDKRNMLSALFANCFMTRAVFLHRYLLNKTTNVRCNNGIYTIIIKQFSDYCKKSLCIVYIQYRLIFFYFYCADFFINLFT